LRIAINAALLGKRHTGVGTYIIGLIRGLTSLGHEVVVYGNSPLIPTGPDIVLRKTPNSIAFGAGPFAGPLRLLWDLFVLPLKLLGSNTDAIVSQNAEGMLWCSVPQMLVVHDLIPLYYPEETPRLRNYYKKILPLVFANTAAVVAVSQYTRNDLLQQYNLSPANVHVAYDGVTQSSEDEEIECRPASFPIQPYFLFVGTFAPRKNLETVVRALARIRNEVPESLVIVAYTDKWAQGCLQLIRELGLADRIIHLAGLTSQELAYVYGRATALFLLSEYEGFGLPALEAMLAGTPAVVSYSTALAEVVGDAALKISAHDIDAATAAMLRLSTDQAYRQEFRRPGVQRAETFTWTRTGDRISAILSQVVQSRNRKFRATESPR
jgi:glycosyltransferase involved in cell wall biosynthesis